MNQYVVITGGTKGIGRAVVDLLADQGCHIAFCARTSEHVRALEENLSAQYPDQQFVGCTVDMSNSDEVKRFARRVQKEFPQVDVLVNNAGVFLPGEVLKEEEGALELQWQTNVMSAYTLSRLIAPQMIERKAGDIINMCSVAALKAYSSGGSYSITKFAMRGLSLALREELKEHRVRVTTLYPGATWSASWSGVDLPQDRLMNAEDIAKTVLLVLQLDRKAVLEELIIRPQLGDL